jgi:hypothetical protein
MRDGVIVLDDAIQFQGHLRWCPSICM